MNKTQVFTACGAAIVALIIGFFGGMKYQQSKSPAGWMAGNLPNGQMSRFGNSNATRRNSQGGFISGEILNKTSSSFTMRLPNNSGSKIVLYSPSTAIYKSATTTADDLETGKSVMVTGKSNDDGSITAENIQIRSVLPQSGQNQTPPPAQ